METIAKADVGITAFDNDDLKRLRLAQYHSNASQEIVLLGETQETISYTALDTYISDAIAEHKSEVEGVPLIIYAWNIVKAGHPIANIRDFSVIWYDLHIGDRAESRTSVQRNHPILEAVRSLYQYVDGNVGPFSTLSMLDSQMDIYKSELENKVQQEVGRLDQESRVVDALADLKPVNISKVYYTHATTVVEVETLLLDPLMPMANYIGETDEGRRQFYKVYQGVGFDETPPFQSSWLTDSLLPQSINMRIFAGNNLVEAVEKDYTPAVYRWDVVPQRVQISVPFQRGFTQERGVQIIFDHLKEVRITNQYARDIECSLKVQDFSFRDDIFAEMVMNDPVFAQYLHIRETSLIVVTNRRPTYHMNLSGPETLYFRIENRESKINEPFMSTDGSTILMEEKTPYTSLTITASNDQVIDSFLIIIPRLLSRYLDQFEDIIEEYKRFIPSYGNFELEHAPSSSAIETTIKQLENIAPRVFTNNYARSCQSDNLSFLLRTR
jgi:hypothetical protein